MSHDRVMMNEKENWVDLVNYVIRGGKLATKCRLRDEVVGGYFCYFKISLQMLNEIVRKM